MDTPNKLKILTKKVSDTEPVSMKVTRKQLQWLGHLARMPDNRMLKSALLNLVGYPSHALDVAHVEGGETSSEVTSS